jgi:hypothetical protein
MSGSLQETIAALDRLHNTPRKHGGNYRHGPRKNRQVNVNDLEEFVKVGGMRAIEYAIGAKAAQEAIQVEREWWLKRLEDWLRYYEHPYAVATIQGEIRRLRRCLGIKRGVSPEERRAAIRERVRKHRAKARCA